MALAALAGVTACGTSEPKPVEPPEDDSIPQVETPPADGPQLVVTRPGVVVRDRPSASGKVLGTLRAGGRVARAAVPYSKKGCPGGWYPIRPRGFVCAGVEATTDLDSPVARQLTTAPDLSRAMPYRYARVRRGDAVAYRQLPTETEQQAAEPDLRKQKSLDPKRLGLTANDVPLDEQGMPKGPPVLLANADGVAADGYRTTESFFLFPEAQPAAPPLAAGVALRTGIDDTQVLRRDSGVALLRSFLVGEGPSARRFGTMADGRFIPIDRLVPAPGTAWHGVSVSDGGLPVAFALRVGVLAWKLDKDKATVTDEEFEPQQPIALSGRFRTVNSVMYYCTRENEEQWVRAKDIILVSKRNKFPDFAVEGQKWVDVSLANQTLTAFVGHKPLYATLVSSGQDRLGDPTQGPATIQGVFKLRSKHITRDVDPKEAGDQFTLTDVPWVAEFAEGFALTGSYWLTEFGAAQSYHNVALAPVDAHFLWSWSDPQVPDGWHSVVIDENGPNTIVYVHR